MKKSHQFFAAFALGHLVVNPTLQLPIEIAATGLALSGLINDNAGRADFGMAVGLATVAVNFIQNHYSTEQNKNPVSAPINTTDLSINASTAPSP